MRRDAKLVAVVVAAIVVLTLAISSSDQVWFAQGEARPAERAEVEEPDQLRPEATGEQQLAEQPAPEQDWFGVVATILLVLMAAALLVLLLRRGVERRRRRRREREVTASTIAGASDLADADVVASTLLAATDDLTTRLASGEPRNAIVACWVELEDVCAGIGLARSPAETSVEFTSRVLATYAVAVEPIDRLARLYREARFSEHHLTEDHRRRAIEALTALTGQLRRRATPVERLP